MARFYLIALSFSAIMTFLLLRHAIFPNTTLLMARSTLRQTRLTNPQQTRLSLNSDSTFKISIFSDLHYGEDEFSFGPAADVNSGKVIRHVLDNEKPDFVIMNGDLITGENTYHHNSTLNFDVLVKPLVDGGYRWASTYGNHDSKFNLSREALFEREHRYEGALTQHGPSGTDGVTNYMIPIYPSKSSREGKPVALLYFFDSRGGSQGNNVNNDNIGNWVTEATAAWFTQTSNSAQAKWGVVPSFLFVHIPIYAYSALQSSGSGSKLSSKYFPGLNDDKPLAPQGDSAVGPYSGQDIPFMQAILNTKGLHSIYTGHDHGDSWCGLWPDEAKPHAPSSNSGSEFASNGRPFLCFCKHTGYGGYGNWFRGSRQLQLRFGADGRIKVESWVRMQFGDDHPQVVTRIGLNSTYGKDEYPTEAGGHRH